jgi:hypothetical protein
MNSRLKIDNLLNYLSSIWGKAQKFNPYRFKDYKEQVIKLLGRVCRVSVETVRIVREMEAKENS